jgi:hypothetical protein
MNEAFSSVEAESMLKEAGVRIGAGDGRVDSLAAARILESFLALPGPLRKAASSEKLENSLAAEAQAAADK